MKKLGRVSHYAKQGFLIIRGSWVPNLNDRVVDKNLTLVGVVKDVFGPVKTPYIAVKPRVKSPEEYVGAVLYLDTREKKGKTGKKQDRARKGGKSRKTSRKPGTRGGNSDRKRRPTPANRG